MIKNLIFDIGNVLLGYRTPEIFAEEGLSQAQIDRIVANVFADPAWSELDLGIRPFWDVMEQLCRNIPDLQGKVYWLMENNEKMKVDRPRVWERVRLLKEQGYGIYLLSNYAEFFAQKHFAHAPFIEWIDGAMISYQVHQIKPNPAIYLALLEKYSLRASECLFFDDLEKNVRAADALGINAFHVTSEEQLIRKLDELLL